MPDIGRTLVYPTSAIMFGARPIDVPGRGNMLCISAGVPFRISTGQLVKPADWYETLAAYCGMTVAPDSMAPLPSSEVVVLGTVPAVDPREGKRRAVLRCGSTQAILMLHADPQAEGVPMTLDPAAAAWHEEDNPQGRNTQEQPPLILLEADEKRPVWLGITPFDHPLRARLAGKPDAQSGIGWPADADPKILCESHPLFWGEGIYPGDPLVMEGFSDTPIQAQLPRYRMTLMSGHVDGTWLMAEDARIHSLMLLPQADMATMNWRTAIATGDDILGEKIVVALGALEDVGSEPKPVEYWSGLVAERWFNPDQAMDERLLLPETVAVDMPPPFTEDPKMDSVKNRHEEAKAWVQEETGMPDNPFEKEVPDKQQGIMKSMNAMASGEEPPDGDRLSAIAKEVMADSRERHEAAGFTEDKRPDEDKPKERGEELDAEIAKRLEKPYSSEREMNMVQQTQNYPDLPHSEDISEKIAATRLIGAAPVLNWPLFNDDEAKVFGERLVERLNEGDLKRHVDISGVTVAAEGRSKIGPVKFDELLAEKGIWREIDWHGCEFGASTFVEGNFENCNFENCVFEKTNLSKATMDHCNFTNCTFKDLQIMEPVWRFNKYENCTFEDLTIVEPVYQSNTFTGGYFKTSQFVEGIMLECTFEATNFNEVTLAALHAPNNTFRKIEMYKVWGMNKGMPGCTFEEIRAHKCGFIGPFYFTDARFISTHFTEVGFSAAQFRQVYLTPGCIFDRCEFTGAVFEDAELTGVRFLGCSMVSTEWENVQAGGAWFFESMLRGVDFGETELARAVFADADLDGAVFQPERTIGADFKGTVVALKGA